MDCVSKSDVVQFQTSDSTIRGTAENGNPKDDCKPWSLLEVEEFLFAIRDKEKWIVVNRATEDF